ncbi:DUF2634 domain-containing protein [Paenibacillaceae bacterium WGS1546]|uniref:DUF2634 domain-containing protein n=1 Tax=Cohnella sp. WGS1546 TaxID=3366810 RepID=UPI00372CFFD7
MIPTGSALESVGLEQTDPIEAPSRTYRLDVQTGVIAGMIDGLEAVRQAAFKILQTERFRHLIYSADYGSEAMSLIGRDRFIYRSELKRTIEEALLQDDRIVAVEGMDIEFGQDHAIAWFTVVTPFGQFRVSQEVR